MFIADGRFMGRAISGVQLLCVGAECTILGGYSSDRHPAKGAPAVDMPQKSIALFWC